MGESRGIGVRLVKAGFWLAPILFLFWLYADGLGTWFVGDDFYWLSLLRTVHGFHDVIHVLLAPAAQGTIRPLSERGFFLLFESLFGLDSLPFRICVFITMAGNLTLVAWITRRITGSAAAGAFAAILWTANTALVTVLAWSSSYNEALCSLFLLGALSLLMRYVETGRSAFWWWQAVVFTLGFGALEINIVYPALAAAYVLFVAAPEKRRPLLTGLAPLFCISIVYFVAHRIAVQFPRDGPYAVHIDGSIFGTLATYWEWSIVPETWKDLGHSALSEHAIFWVVTAALAAFCARQLLKARHAVLFFASWFLIAVAPVLPLPGHRSDYYLTIPLIGVAMLAGWGVSQALESRWIWRLATVIPLAAYLGCMIPVTLIASRWWLDRSQAVRGLVLGVQAAEAAHPGKTIVLDGVTSDVYNISLADSAITFIGLKEVYLTPREGDIIHPVNDFGRLPHLVMEAGALRIALASGQALVYADAGDHLRNITGVWQQKFAAVSWTDQEPR
jgi:hypothetical protein